MLWADDEIDLLRPHVKMLEDRGFAVEGVSNGEDAVYLVAKEGRRFDLVILDEMMPGIDGLETLQGIKAVDPSVPVIMVTKSEDEDLADAAIRREIDNYLVKPVNPLQVFTACRRLLDGARIRESGVMRDYVEEFTLLRNLREGEKSPDVWLETHRKLADWDLRLDSFRDAGLLQTHEDAKHEANVEFSRFVASHYAGWISADPSDRPTLSVDIVRKFVAPLLRKKRKVYFIVLDCLRLDQWVAMEQLLEPFFDIRRHHYFSILPTATPFSRNAIFSGLHPLQIARKHPELWAMPGDDETSLNRHEHALLDAQLKRLGAAPGVPSKYVKVVTRADANNLRKGLSGLYSLPLVSMVFNFIDILSHGRSDSDLLREVAPDEAAFRSLAMAWFKHSALFEILKAVSRQDATVVVTTDHGSIIGRHASMVQGNRDTTTNLRFKIGSNLGCDTKHALHIKDPEAYQLPSMGLGTHYIIARENYYFVYPTKFHEYERQFRGSFQHGGISLEEMVLPVAVMNPR
ncbi:MAG: bifunctional response regulator/alkaline phosphatase family protein [Gemmatimonadota bacterium]|nr:bifunctional response regulator/alkaline phosphatase family protein [Gemmatimonadota bacterium]MDP7031287.1 bifunctional response regulator/alkaline phosphatase family protein [Gemmatimonadota bacterium]